MSIFLSRRARSSSLRQPSPTAASSATTIGEHGIVVWSPRLFTRRAEPSTIEDIVIEDISHLARSSSLS